MGNRVARREPKTTGSHTQTLPNAWAFRRAPCIVTYASKGSSAARSRGVCNIASPLLKSSRSSKYVPLGFLASLAVYSLQRSAPASERSARGTVSKNGLAFLVDELHLERRAVFRVNQMQEQGPRKQGTGQARG